MYDIRTIGELVSELDGPLKLGEQLGITQEAVSNWIARGSIPGGWHTRLCAMAYRKGMTVDPRVFDLTEKEVEGLMKLPRVNGRRSQSVTA